MSGTFEVSGPIKVGSLAADPSDTGNGLIYYNSSTHRLILRENGSFTTIVTGASATSSFFDDSFNVKNLADATKILAFDVSSVATATTRTVTMADANVNLIDVNNSILKDGSRGFTANQPMGTFKLTGLGNGTSAGDSVRYEQAILASGVNAFAANQSMGGFKLTGLGNPTANGDALRFDQLGVSSGIATLDGGGKVPASQLPNTVMEFQGQWNATTNSPSLSDGVGNAGDTYRVNVAGTQTFDSISLNFGIGDLIMYSGTVWQKTPGSDAVMSVFNRQGVVTAENGDYTASKITNAPSGNLAAITVQLALNELQSDIDTRSLTGGTLAQFAATTSAQLAGVISDETGSGSLVFATSPTLVTPDLGTPSALVGTNITGTASGLTSGTVTTNANLTGPVTSTGNATDIANGAISNAMLANGAVANLSGTNSGDITLSAAGVTGDAKGAILTGQALALQQFTATQPGIAPLSGGGTANFLRADGSWSPAGTGTVTAVSVSSANGFAGSSSGGATPALTLSTTITGVLKGDGTAISAATAGADYLTVLTGDVTTINNAATVPNSVVIGKVLTGYASGAGTVAATDTILQAIEKLNGNNATNANLTGPITSTGNATAVGAQTGTGSTFVMNTSPTLVTPNIGAATLGGDMTLGANVLVHSSGGLQRGSSNSDFLQEEYFHSIALSASQTNTVIASLTFAHASYEGFEMHYKVKEATTNNVRIAKISVVTNGTNISVVETGNQTASTGVTFDAIVNGANVNIRYSSGANTATLRADVKRIKT